MYIHIGKSSYGTCDVVPELFYVATSFVHFDMIPLVPTETQLVLLRNGKKYAAVKLPLSVKSIVLTWTRLANFAGLISMTIMGILALSDHGGLNDALGDWTIAGFCGVMFAFFMIFPRKRMPSYQRACQLAELARFNETSWAALNVLYGRDPFDRPRKPEDTFPVR